MKTPLKQRSLKEQTLYHTKFALSWLKIGAPYAAQKSLKAALVIVKKDPSLSYIKPLLTKAITETTSWSPRQADYTVKDILKKL